MTQQSWKFVWRLILVGSATVVLGFGFGVQGPVAPVPTFEVATVKPHPPDSTSFSANCHGHDSHYPAGFAAPPPLGHCSFIRVPLGLLIRFAFAPSDPRSPEKINGGPSWVNTDVWDIDAKAEDVAKSSEAELQLMMQSLLAERFKLQIHRGTEDISGFALVGAKGGTKMKRDETCDALVQRANGQIFSFKNMTMPIFTRFLAAPAGGTVLDKTGLDGCYSFTFEMPPALKASPSMDSEDSGPSINTSLQSLGLRLETQKIPVEVITIDHAEKPDGKVVEDLAIDDAFPEPTSRATTRKPIVSTK